jgi:hypothetical protein
MFCLRLFFCIIFVSWLFSDTMALQEQNAALKVKDLVSWSVPRIRPEVPFHFSLNPSTLQTLRLETVESARRVLETELQVEQTKTRELEVQHLEGVPFINCTALLLW